MWITQLEKDTGIKQAPPPADKALILNMIQIGLGAGPVILGLAIWGLGYYTGNNFTTLAIIFAAPSVFGFGLADTLAKKWKMVQVSDEQWHPLPEGFQKP